MTTAEEQDARTKTILAGLKRHERYLADYGRRVHELYPLAKMPPEIFEAITVPVSLPVCLLLFGLASAMVAKMPPIPKEEKPNG